MTRVRLKPKREKSLLHKHPWVFSGAVDAVDGEPGPGDVVDVVDSSGGFVARGYYNARSNIRVRALAWDAAVAIDNGWWRGKIATAVEARVRFAGDDSTTAYRLVHSEADGLPGLIVDRYGDYLVVQLLTAGVEKARAAVVDALDGLLHPAAIYDRSDADTRKREGLAPSVGWVAGEPSDGALEILENGFRFAVDFTTGQKTGFYLDQRDNRAVVAGYAAGCEVLDAFSYTGAFSVYAAASGAKRVTLVDSAATAISLAADNLSRNGVAEERCELIQGDVFEVLREFRDAGRTFEMVILDPPKFARTRAQAEKALRGYKDINLLAMKILSPGGILATFSCSGGVDTEAHGLAVAWAAKDAGREVQVLRRLTQPEDHPLLLSFPESEYLKGLLCRVR